MRYLSDQQALLWLARPEKTLIVAGAGLSVSTPTSMPGVSAFLPQVAALLESASGYSDGGTSGGGTRYRRDDYRERLFPEALYGAIAEAYRTREHLNIWAVLDREHAIQAGANPNSGHHAVVALAANNGWPVVTTNFDDQIEEAARVQGIPLRCHLLGPETGLTIESRPGAADLLKVHGTAENPATIRSMDSDLSKSYRLIRGIRLRPMPSRVLIIGYSGRDFDLFPWLATTFGGAEVLWVDPNINTAHRASKLGDINAYRGPWGVLADTLAITSGISVAPPAQSTIEAYEASVRVAIDEHCRRLIETGQQEKAVSAMMGVLVACGAHRDASALAGEYLARAPESPDDPVARIQTLLWASKAEASVDRFLAGRDHARAAERVARVLGTRRERGRARIAGAYNRVSALWLRVPDVAIAEVPRSRQLAVLAYPIYVAVAYAPDAAIWYRKLLDDSASLPDARTYRFVTDYLEHLIRLMTFLDKVGGRHQLSSRVVSWAWLRLSAACSNVGYTLGVLNVSKYTTRKSHDYSAPGAAIAASEVMGDLVAQVIAYRDAGIGTLRLRRSEMAAEELLAIDALASEYLSSSVRLAKTLGCPSLQIKALVAMRRAGLGGPLPSGSVDGFLNETQAPTLQSQRAHLVRILEDLNPPAGRSANGAE